MSKSKLFFDVAASLDGFIAPEGMDLAHANDPEFKQWMSRWTKLQNWVFQQQFFRKNLELGKGLLFDRRSSFLQVLTEGV